MKKNLIVILMILSNSLCVFQFPIIVSAQQFDNSSESTEAVTSTNDAILKSILIISQVSILGIIFNHMFFQKISNKKIHNHTENKNYIYDNNQYLKRFNIIVSLCCISIIFTSTGIILLSAYELSKETAMDLVSTLSILYSTSVGQVWTIRITTSSLIIGLVIIHYILKNPTRKKKIGGDNLFKNNTSNISNSIISISLIVIIILSSINLFSNSMISHSNALSSFSSLALSIDWIHFMAVSIWIGGLFYLSTILLKGVKLSLYNKSEFSNTNNNKDEMKKSIENTQHVSILLMYFSFVAIVALTIIGITGLYLGLIHLQSLNAIFNTSYGNILIIKLSLAFPLILLGRFNQLKIQNYAESLKNILKTNTNNDNSNTFIIHNEKRLEFFNTVNRSLKIESIIGISVLIAASFLSVTSPPSLSTTSTQDFILNGNNNADVSSTNIITTDFSVLVIILSIIILIISIINFRKNQQKIKEIFITT
jgi:copper transport protein